MTIASKNYALYHLRIDAGLTQAEAAAKMGVHRVTFCAWENGTTPIPPRRYKNFVMLVGDTVTRLAATERTLPVRNPPELTPGEKEKEFFAAIWSDGFFDRDGVGSHGGRWFSRDLSIDHTGAGPAGWARERTPENYQFFIKCSKATREEAVLTQRSSTVTRAVKSAGLMEAMNAAAPREADDSEEDFISRREAWWQAYQEGGGLV